VGLREKLNQNPKAAAGGIAAILVVAFGAVGWYLFGGENPQGAGRRVFYSVDDGKTWFADADVPEKIPPFKHEGKDAYRALVWTCDGGKTKFVSALQRFIPPAKAKLEELKNKKDDPIFVRIIEGEGVEYKRPGAEGWIAHKEPAAARLYAPLCAQGQIEGVVPE
jgi:hypothetical protein